MDNQNIKDKKRKVSFAAIISFIALFFAFLQNVITVALEIKVFKLGIIPNIYLIIPILITVGLDILAIYSFFSKETVLSIILLIISIALIIVESYAFFAVKKSDETINEVFEETPKEYIEMIALVRLEDSAHNLDMMNEYKIGYCKDEKYAKPVIEDIEAATEKVELLEETSLVSTMDSLISKSVDAIIVKASDIETISEYENYADYIDRVRIIYRKNVEVEDLYSGIELDFDYDYISDENSMVIYLSGIDTWGNPSVRSRSDLNILMIVNKKTNRIQFINTPRDYYVYLPYQKDMDKLTHAGLCGIKSSEAALENIYGVKIDYYVRVNFEGFEKIIDALGGIDVYSEYEFTAVPRYDQLAGEWHKAEHFDQGINHLNGAQALIFSRERAAFEMGDIQRGKNQMEMMKGVMDKITSPIILLKYDDLLDVVKECAVTDIPSDEIYSLIQYQISTGKGWKMDMYSPSGRGKYMVTYTIPDEENYVLMPNEDEVSKAKELIGNILSDK